MFSRSSLLFIFIILSIFKVNAQDCNLTINGKVTDEGSGLALPYVTIFIQEISKGTITDDNGDFSFDNICNGHYHLTFSHIGCQSKKIHIDLPQDTSLNVSLPHTSTALNTVVIQGSQDEQNNQAKISINRQTLEDNTNLNLAGMLENEAGVNLLKNGSGISKPVIHGLFGNRLTILNNGIVQSGQQWGNDHSPEIDPFSADKISVLKGANAIEYGPGNLGGVILIEPKRIEREPHLHGQVNYFHETNGRGNGINTRLQQYTPNLAWRISGTLKKYGDRKTASYFLNNTGLEEANIAIQLAKTFNDKLFLEFYASSFNTTLGILRGSHIGNITDLEQALKKDIPFFTEPDFSYEIEAPSQKVAHHLVKGKAKYYLSDKQNLEFVFATQLNDRREFDIRRNERSDIPALSLSQYTLDFDLKYSNNFREHWNLKVGSQNRLTDNTNNPETGILPLIPDYLSWKNGVYTSLSKSKNQTQFSIGLRYDNEFQHALTISNSVPREIIRYRNQFQNLSGIAALKFDLNNKQSIALNSGFAMRNPAINELYSNGLHQGVSGIEVGDINLTTEKAIKNTIEYKWFPNANISFNALAYHQHFNNYIFLNPQNEIRLTIRGAFPVFKYEQTDANIYGLDLSSQLTISNAFLVNVNYSYLKGQDISNNRPLIFMPSNNLFGNIIYRLKETKQIGKAILLEQTEFEINNRLVFKQSELLSDQDFVEAPPTYNLLGAKISSNLLFSTYKIRGYIKADNLLNVQYRDYLNRQRYFADDLGRSFTIGINFKF